MNKYGIVKYISTRGLGYEDEVELYEENDKLYVISQISGKKVAVQWLEKGKSIEPLPIINDENSW